MAVDAYVNAQNFDIDIILPDLMYDEMDLTGAKDELLALLPLSYDDTDLVKWNQYENGYGLLSLRGLGGEPDVVSVPGFREYSVSPGYYGERAVLDETEMTKNRQPGMPNLPADPEERLGIITQYQASKSVSRFRKTISDFLVNGRFVNVDASGKVAHADRIENYRTFVTGGTGMGTGWAAAPTTCVPINDLKYVQNQLQIGTSSRFGPDSKILCQDGVLVDLLATTQIQSTYKSKFGSSIMGPEGVNELLIGFGLPKLAPYNEGYYNTLADSVARTTANFTRILPVKTLIWAGTRPKAQKIGRFALTRNVPLALLKGGAKAPLKSRAVDTYSWAEGLGVALYLHDRLPFRYELDVWFNGGPVVNYGSAVSSLAYT